MTTRLVLVRHGQSACGESGIIGGHRGCTGLTQLGRDQAARLCDRLRGVKAPTPDPLITSVLARAIETAGIVAGAFTDPPTIEQDCDVCELHPGEADGMTYEQFSATYGVEQLEDPEAPMSPGGDSRVTFDRRIRSTVARVVGSHGGKSILIVSHGGFIAGACLYLLGGPGLAERRSGAFFSPQHTSLTEFVRPDSSVPWTFERYNDAAHLEARTAGTTSSR